VSGFASSGAEFYFYSKRKEEEAHYCMCKEMPVISVVNRVVDKKRIIGKNWRAEEEERHKGLLTRPLLKKYLHQRVNLIEDRGFESRSGC
jgi:hypothetical protein